MKTQTPTERTARLIQMMENADTFAAQDGERRYVVGRQGRVVVTNELGTQSLFRDWTVYYTTEPGR